MVSKIVGVYIDGKYREQLRESADWSYHKELCNRIDPTDPTKESANQEIVRVLSGWTLANSTLISEYPEDFHKENYIYDNGLTLKETEDLRSKQGRLTINIDPKLHTDFKVICAQQNQSIKSVVVQLMEEYNKQYINNLNKRAQND